MARFLYFAWVRERLGRTEERVELPAGVNTVSAVMTFLRERGEPYRSVLADDRLRVAVNQTHARAGDAVADADEIAIFPPVSGG